MALRSRLNKRCFLCFWRTTAGDMLLGGGSGGMPDQTRDGGADVEDTEVRADAALRAGEAERGLEVEPEAEREWVWKKP